MLSGNRLKGKHNLAMLVTSDKGRWTTLLIALQRNRKVYCLRSSQIKPKTLG